MDSPSRSQNEKKSRCRSYNRKEFLHNLRRFRDRPLRKKQKSRLYKYRFLIKKIQFFGCFIFPSITLIHVLKLNFSKCNKKYYVRVLKWIISMNLKRFSTQTVSGINIWEYLFTTWMSQETWQLNIDLWNILRRYFTSMILETNITF